jgi:hypothetical protein
MIGMKIRHMIVTHKEPNLLHKQLCSIYHNNKIECDYSLCVLNNHPEFKIDPEFSHVKVIHNQTRHPNSNGHLARDWNTGLILGFEDLKNPACDIVILSQNDAVFDEFFLDKIVEIHKTWEFCTYGKGDEVMSFSPEHIKKVGLFSEHYALRGLQEGDFWLRSKRKNRDRSSINDEFHKQTHNPIDHKVTMFSLCGMERRQEFDKSKDPYVKIASEYYNQKWQGKHHWVDLDNEDGGKFVPKEYMFYPWFERDVDQSNYIYTIP